MALNLNIEKFSNCPNYDGDKDNLMVEVAVLERGMRKTTLSSSNKIVFLLEGKVFLSMRDNPDGYLSEGQFALMPAGDEIHCDASMDSKLLIVQMLDDMHQYGGFCIYGLYNKIDKIQSSETLFTLAINQRLDYFIRGLIDIYTDGLRCRNFLQAKIIEMMVIIQAYYPEDQLSGLFSPVLSPDVAFAGYVRMYHLKYRTVNKLADAIHMTVQQFTRRFQAVFHQTPYEWIQKERARLIHRDICLSTKPFKEIAYDYGFTDSANFNRFCKTAYGMNPKIIREGATGRTGDIRY